MRDDACNLPRFTHIAVADDVIDPRALPGVLDKVVDIRDWPDGVPVVVERKEIVYTPGAYSLIMSDSDGRRNPSSRRRSRRRYR